MPISLSLRAITTSKQFNLLVIFLLSPLFFFAQTLTGLWTGSLSNDSTTNRKDQSFEIVLTEYKDKVYGYSRSEFIVNDTLYYIVKRVKGTIVRATDTDAEDICEVSDDEIVAYNFRGKLDKGIKVTSTFRRSQSDSAWHLDGKWKTNATKKYYAVSGKVGLAEEKDLTASKIFPHLEELKLTSDIAFYNERKEAATIVKFAKPEKNGSILNTKSIDATSVNIVAAKPDLERVEATYIKTVTPTEKENSSRSSAVINSTAAVNIAPSKPDLQRADPEYMKTVEAVEKTNSIVKNNSIETTAVNIVVAKPDLQRVEADYIKTVEHTETNNSSSKKDLAINKQFAVKPNVKQAQTPVAITTKQPTVVADIAVVSPIKNNINKNIGTPVIEKQTIPSTKNQTQSVATVTSVKPKDAAIVSNNVANNTTTKPVATSASEKLSIATIASTTKEPVIKKSVEEITSTAAVISGRKSEFSQGVTFKSDSLVIALYDNGEIDGDTVSIYMNGELIMAKQGLKASAIKKTIHIKPGSEDFSLVLYADNLGKYPPNTGLLVVYDGDDTYNLRFSSDFQKNAGIVFRRKE